MIQKVKVVTNGSNKIKDQENSRKHTHTHAHTHTHTHTQFLAFPDLIFLKILVRTVNYLGAGVLVSAAAHHRVQVTLGQGEDLEDSTQASCRVQDGPLGRMVLTTPVSWMF